MLTFSKNGCGLKYFNLSHKELVCMPRDFNLEQHLLDFPPKKNGFYSKKFSPHKAYSLFLLFSSIPARNGDLIDEDGFIRIHQKTLANSIKDANSYFNYLAKTGVIEINRQYIVDKKSRGYKWAPKYEEQPFIVREVNTGFSYGTHQCGDLAYYGAYPYLFHWYREGKLMINPDASNYAYRVKERKMREGKTAWDINGNNGNRKYPPQQYQTTLFNLDKLQRSIFDAHIDGTGHRLHSTLTNLDKEYRNFLSYNGMPLVSIDVKNCQPYLSGLLFNPEFWAEDSRLPINMYNLPDGVKIRFPEDLIDEIRKFLAKNEGVFDDYIDMVSKGRIYDNIAKIVNERQGPDAEPITREKAKKVVFSLLFSHNRASHQLPDVQQIKQIFSKELYPAVAEFFMLIKKHRKGITVAKQHNRLAILLQAIESQIVLHRCCKRIWEEKKGTIPIFTIHDSLVTTQEHQKYVQSVLDEELSLCIGHHPQFGIEQWGTDRVKHRDLLL